MSKKIWAMMLVMTIIFCMSGCQLAKPENKEESEKGRLVGVFVTADHMDFMDLEGYAQENLENITAGGTAAGTYPETAAKIYGELIEKTVVDSDGAEHKTVTYEFQGLEGMVLAVYSIDSPQGSYSTTAAGRGMSDVEARLGGEDAGISGTIWMAKGSGEVIFYMNPVYQTEDGTVYMVPGSGIHVSANTEVRAKHGYFEEITITEDGKQIKQNYSVDVAVDFAQPVESVTLIQINAQQQVIGRATFDAEALPESFTPEEGTAYIMVEKTSGDEIEREILNPGEAEVSLFVSFNAQICIRKNIKIDW